jgi:mannitol-1-/sugar-/sorbitol-6-phosphatase
VSEIVAGAVLFDKDGVLLDTMAMIRSAWTDWAIKRGIDADEVMASIHMTAYELLARFAPAADPVTEIREIAAMQAVLEPSISAFPGAAELLRTTPEDAWAIVTSARREPATRHLTAAGLPVPRVLISAEDTPRGKPDPSGYILAAQRLGARPRDCIVVEDVPAGIRAGRAAGMFVIAVATTHPAGDLGDADAILPSLSALQARSEDGRLRVSWRTAP